MVYNPRYNLHLLLCYGSDLLLFFWFFFSGRFAATFYYNDNVGAADGAWNNINNWWTDSTLTIQATDCRPR